MTATPELGWNAIGAGVNFLLAIVAYLAFRESRRAVKAADAQAQSAKEAVELPNANSAASQIPHIRMTGDNVENGFVNLNIINASNSLIMIEEIDIFIKYDGVTEKRLTVQDMDKSRIFVNRSPLLSSGTITSFVAMPDFWEIDKSSKVKVRIELTYLYMGTPVKRYMYPAEVFASLSAIRIEQDGKSLPLQTES